jgi:hypothetical protein
VHPPSVRVKEVNRAFGSPEVYEVSTGATYFAPVQEVLLIFILHIYLFIVYFKFVGFISKRDFVHRHSCLNIAPLVFIKLRVLLDEPGKPAEGSFRLRLDLNMV